MHSSVTSVTSGQHAGTHRFVTLSEGRPPPWSLGHTAAVTLSSLLGAALRDDPGRPLVTWYGAGASERVELSVATAANWVAKTANYLEDDRDVGPGDALGLAPTPHWVSAVVAWATWTLGAAVDLQAPAVDLPLDLAAFSRLVLAQPDAYAGGPAGPDAVAVRAAGAEWSQGTLVAAVRA